MITRLLLTFFLILGIAPAQTKPNIVLIISDDMGFSDLGCYGGEIHTPNLDRLASQGLRFSQFYNASKCEPSRAALLTGQHFWSRKEGMSVRIDSPNIGEVLQGAGYRTMMTGKWHVAGQHPFERGFNRHFGFMGGGTDFFLGDKTFTLDGKPWDVPKKDFYVTHSITDYSVKFIQEETQAYPAKPFFLYVGYNAPHSSLQAPAATVAKYRGGYRIGWDELRKRRFAKQKEIGLATEAWHFPERSATIPAWDSLPEKDRDFEDLRMATYAAMIDEMDQGIGRILTTLDDLKIADNTLVLFMNDNGASPNDRARQGEFGSPGSNWNTGVGWAQVSCTPFKYYKRSQHGGGVTSPLIARWPAAIKPRTGFEDQAVHIADFLPTFIDLAGTTYPTDFKGKTQPKLPGVSLAGVLKTGEKLAPRDLYFQLFNNMAVISGHWKIATSYNQPWQLYDLATDRTETRDLAAKNPEKLAELLKLQAQYGQAEENRLRLSAGEREPEYALPYRADGRIGPGSNENVPNEKLNLALVKIRADGREPTADEIAKLESDNSDKDPKPKRRKSKKSAE